METDRAGPFAVLGGSILVAFGFVGLASTTYLTGSAQLSTGEYIQIWADTIVAILLGFLVIIGGFLIASSGEMRRTAGGIVGILGSIAGGFNALVLLLTTAGLSSPISQSTEFSIAYELLVIGSVVVLFAGFPIGMFGSVEGMTRREIGSIETEAEPTA